MHRTREVVVRVKVSGRDRSVPEEFLFSVLTSVLGMSREEYERVKGEDGSVTLYIRDPAAVERLRRIGEKYSHLLNIEFEDAQRAGGAFTLTNTAVRSNWGLALSWSAVVLLLTFLSVVPVVGVLSGVLLNVFMYAFVIFVAHRLASADLSSTGEILRSLRLRDVYPSYLRAGFGLWLGFILLSLLLLALFLILAVLLAGLGEAFGGTEPYGSLPVLAGLVLVLVIWIAYSVPLIVHRTLREEKPTFRSSLLAVVSVFTPGFIAESFGSVYVGIGGMWSLVLTVGTVALVVMALLVVTLPVALLIAYWLQLFLSISAVLYTKRS